MQDFYITRDMRKSSISVVPTIQNQAKAYCISFEELWIAENFLRKINSKLISPPHKDPQSYHLTEIIKEELGEIEIYVYLKTV